MLLLLLNAPCSEWSRSSGRSWPAGRPCCWRRAWRSNSPLWEWAEWEWGWWEELPWWRWWPAPRWWRWSREWEWELELRVCPQSRSLLENGENGSELDMWRSEPGGGQEAAVLTVLALGAVEDEGLYEHVRQRHAGPGRSDERVFTFARVARVHANVCNVRLCRHLNSFYKQGKKFTRLSLFCSRK